MLTSDKDDMDFIDPQIQLVKYLGSGASGEVFSARIFYSLPEDEMEIEECPDEHLLSKNYHFCVVKIYHNAT